jgi:hypothetical protein
VNFVVFGALIIAFGLGVGQAVQPGRLSWLGPLFLVISGAGETLAAFNTDRPTARRAGMVRFTAWRSWCS